MKSEALATGAYWPRLGVGSTRHAVGHPGRGGAVASSEKSELRQALDLSLSEILRADLGVGVVGGVAGLVVALVAPGRLAAPTNLMVQAVGVVLGAVVAALAILAALLDQPFLRKLRAIGRHPRRYLQPFVFTAVIGVTALVLLVVLGTMSEHLPPAVLAPVATFAGLFGFWTIASPIPLLATLLDFVALKNDALDVPDDVDIPRRATGTEGRR